MELIGNVDYFRETSEKVRQELFYSLKQEYYEEGEQIFDYGDPANKIFFICSGQIDLYIPDRYDEDDVHIETLKIGASIGSYSILSTKKRFFSARASSNVAVTVLSKPDLIGIELRFPEVQR